MSELTTLAALKAQAFERLLRDRRVLHGAFRLFHLVNQHADAQGRAWPGRRSMKRIIGGDFTSLQKWVGRLVETGCNKRANKTDG